MRFFKDLAKYSKYTFFSAKATLKSEVANSYLNWIWWLLEPFFYMITYSIVFGLILGDGIQYYPLFIYLGLILWNFHERTIRESVSLIRMNQSIVDKVYLPKFVLLLVRILVNGFKMLLAIGVLTILMLYFNVRINSSLIYIVVPLMVMCVLTFGMGTILLHFGVFVEDLQYVISILLQIIFFANGIFYDVEQTIPAPFGGWIARFNPMTSIITAARDAMLYGRITHVKDMAVWLVVGAVLAIIGIALMYKNENNYVKVI